MFSFRRSSPAYARTAIVHGTAARAVATVRHRPGERPLLAHAASEGRPRSGQAWRATQALLRAAPARGGHVAAVLPASESQLLLTEAPDVPDEDLRAAMRWKIRDQLAVLPDQAAIDVFRLPSMRGKSGLVHVVAATQVAVNEIEAIVIGADRRLDVIDVPELALRNLMRLLPQDETGCALLLLARSILHILVTTRGVLYVARRIELPYGAGHEEIALQLQRSLQYYESQFDRAPVTEVIVAPEGAACAELARELSTASGLHCVPLDLAGLLATESAAEPIESAELLFAVGAALRPPRAEAAA